MCCCFLNLTRNGHIFRRLRGLHWAPTAPTEISTPRKNIKLREAHVGSPTIKLKFSGCV